MRILLLHNHYGSHSGESTVLDVHHALLEKHGHEIIRYTRSSVELGDKKSGMAKAFFTALYNPHSIREVREIIRRHDPDIVHIHNMYPLLSPSVLPEIKRMGIPVIMTVHNYRLICPNGLFYNKEGICERCSNGREWNCVLMNCEENMLKSIGYGLRNAYARLLGYYLQNVDAYLCLTDFQKNKLVKNGYPEARCHVLPNFMDENHMLSCGDDHSGRRERKGFLFIGRLNRQKGIDVIVDAARQCPDIKFMLAGSVDASFIDTASLPSNVKWLGVIGEERKNEELQSARALLFASRSYEGFPMVFLEAMQQCLPVVAPDMAGYPEIVRNGVNGELFPPENSAALAKLIRKFESDPHRSQEYGVNGREILRNEYSGDVWYEQYMAIVSALLQ